MTTYTRRLIPVLFRPLLAAAALALPLLAEAAPPTAHRHVEVDGVRIFYREAGPKDAPHVLLLHGFPSSSHMFRNLIPALADQFHVVAPDYPGFGHSDMPAPERVRLHLRSPRRRDRRVHGARRPRSLRALRPGLRRAGRLPARRPAPRAHPRARRPERQRLRRGLREFWDPIKAYWKDPAEANRQAWPRRSSPRHEVAVPPRHAASRARQPRRWLVDQALLDRPGNKEIQLQLFYSYRTQPAALCRVAGVLPPAPAADADRVGQERSDLPGRGRTHPYTRDLKDVELHLLDTGHFALEEEGDTIARLMRAFLERHLRSRS